MKSKKNTPNANRESEFGPVLRSGQKGKELLGDQTIDLLATQRVEQVKKLAGTIGYTTQGSSAWITVSPVASLITWSSPRIKAPPPARTTPRSIKSAECSG